MLSLIRRLRNKYLSPNSKFELMLRTIYHEFNKTRFAFHIRDWISGTCCKHWLRSLKHKEIPSLDEFPYQPKLSFILSLSNTAEKDFLNTHESINKLIGNQWDITCLYSSKEERDRFSSLINENSNIHFLSSDEKIIERVSGEYILICQTGDLFSKRLLIRFYEALTSTGSLSSDIFYFDCEYVNTKNKHHKKIFFKPSSLSTELLLSVNYLSRGIIRKNILEENDLNLTPENLQTQEYEFALSLQDPNLVYHIPDVLVTQKNLVKPDRKADQKVVVDYLERQGIEQIQLIEESVGTRYVWPAENLSVAIIIPSVNNRLLLEPLIHSILNNKYKNFSIHIVDNNSDDLSILAFYEEIEKFENLSILSYNKQFNYSEAINLGVSESDSDLLLFLNDDMGIINDDWLKELVQWASLPSIGVVGTKLIRRNHTIQHAGIILGLNNFAGHLYLNAPEHYCGLMGSVDWYRNYMAVTGACQMVRRDVFEEVGGYDENYSLAFGDIDFCLKVYEAGYKNMYTPFATLFHYEGQSRGYETPSKDVVQGYRRMGALLNKGDPYFSNNLTLTSIPKCHESSDKDKIAAIESRKQYYEES
jgi:O-antigen biosynthesis protein